MALLKALLRSGVGTDAKAISFAKALIAFPVDVIFLAFSFGAVTLAAAPPEWRENNYATFAVPFYLGCFTLSVLVMILTTKSQSKFEISADDKNQAWILPTASSYGISALAVMFSFLLTAF